MNDGIEIINDGEEERSTGTKGVTAVKKSEDDDALIFRFYEFLGRKNSVRLQLPDKAIRALETNLMEKQERALMLEADRREVVIPTGPYEIKTVKVFFAQ